MPAAQTTARIAYEIQNPTKDPLYLEGKISQTFVDEIAERVSREIEKACSVDGIAESKLILRFSFLPGSSMEYTEGNVTYRRLQLTAKGCTPRDFWVKWTRVDSSSAYTLADDVDPETLEVELGEDVPRKFREREFRYLAFSDAEKYAACTAKRAVTEWRELVNRAVKKGLLVRNKPEIPEASSSDLIGALNALIADYESKTGKSVTAEAPAFAPASAPAEIAVPDAVLSFDMTSAAEEAEPAVKEAATVAEEVALAAEEAGPVAEETVTVAEKAAPIAEAEVVSFSEPKAPDEDEIRREIEAQIRAEYEEKWQQANREKNEILRRESEALYREKLRMEEEARAAKEEELRLRAEKEEKDRIAEEARIAIEARKLAEEAAEEERRRAKEEAERREKEEAERRAAEEAERARREAEEAERRAELEKKLAREKAAAKKAAALTSHTVRLSFRRNIEPGIVTRVREVIGIALECLHKEDVYMRVVASVPDPATVILKITDFPTAERELLIKVIKVLGNSDLGISKITLD